MPQQEFYVQESGTREFVVGERWPFEYEKDKLGSVVTDITAKVFNLLTGEDITATWWPSGSGSSTAEVVTLTPVHMLEAGDYELKMYCTADGVQNKTTRFQFKVFA